MVLHPLAKVRIGVFVPVCVCGSKLMMDILSDGERSQRQKKDDESERKRAEKPCGQHEVAIEYHTGAKAVKIRE